MTRLRLNNISDFSLANPITVPAGAGSCSWTSAPAFPTITAPDYYVLVIEPGTANEDIRYLTAFTSGATSGTVTAAKEGSSGISHTATAWQHGPTVQDFGNGLSIFGDGSDGSPTFDGTTTILGMAPSPSGASGIYTLTRDVLLASPTLNSGITIITNGYHLFASGTFTNNGTIQWDGVQGDTTGPGNSSGTIATATLGAPAGAGSAGAGSNGTNNGTRSLGGAGGAGGAGVNAGGTGGTVTAPGVQYARPRSIFGLLGGAMQSAAAFATLFGGAGGASGGGDSAGHAGGTGGSGGPIVVVAARFFAGTGAIHARGGAGVNGSAGSTLGAGGGGGGGGGLVIVFSASVLAGAISGQTIDANGGTFGTGHGSAGVNGSAGSAGTVILIPN